MLRLFSKSQIATTKLTIPKCQAAVFVGNLSFRANTRDVENAFEKYGTIERVNIGEFFH